jgi:formate dehydrogenase gamma subunit
LEAGRVETRTPGADPQEMLLTKPSVDVRESGMTRVKRFTVSERAVHWLTALAFFILLTSGLVVGRSGTFHDVMYLTHLAAAGVLVFGTALIIVRGNRRALRRTARELRRLKAEDRTWLKAVPARALAGAPEPPTARFNAGQKVNFLGVCILLAALYVSGVDTVIAGTNNNLIFGAHKLATIALCVLVAGHLYMALVNRATRPALRGMVGGTVDREWAHRHHPRWEP